MVITSCLLGAEQAQHGALALSWTIVHNTSIGI